MTHQHRFRIHGLTTLVEAEAIRTVLIGQAGVRDAEVTLTPPQAVLTVESHPSLPDLQQLVSSVGSFHLMEIHDERGANHTHDQTVGATAHHAHDHEAHTNPVASTAKMPAEQQALQHIGHDGHSGPGSPQ